MTERRRGGLGRGLGALIPTARPEDDAAESTTDRRDPAAEYALALVRDPDGAPLAPDGAPAAPEPDRTEEFADLSVKPPTRHADLGAVSITGSPEADGRADSTSESSATSAQHTASEHPADPASVLTDVGARYAELDITAIGPNPRQPRVVFDEDALAELVHSIREIGILQPVVVRELPAGEAVRYELVMGERRWRAAREAGLATVPAIIRDTPDTSLLRDALLENLHRAQLNPLEEAAAYDQLLQDFGCTQDQLAERIGRSRPQISNTLRLLKLPPSVQRRLAAGVLSAGHARALLGLAEGAAQERLAQRVVAEGLSVRSVEEIVAVGPADGAASTGASRVRRPVTAEQTELEQRLSDRFDTRVRIERGRLKGKIVIEFASTADLERITAIIDGSVDAPLTRSA